MAMAKLIPQYRLLPLPLRMLATAISGLLALLFVSFLLLTLFTLWVNNTDRGQTWLGSMLTGLSPASGVIIDISGLRATGPAHINLGRLEARYEDKTFLLLKDAALSFSLATLVERQPVISLAVGLLDINTDVLAELPAGNESQIAFQTPDIAELPFDSLRISSAHIENLTLVSANSRMVFAPHLSAFLMRHGDILDISATLEDTAHDLGQISVATTLQSGKDLAIYLHRLYYTSADISAVLTGQAHWPDFEPQDKIIGLIGGPVFKKNGVEDIYLAAPLNWPIPVSLKTAQNGKPVELTAHIDRNSPYLDLSLPAFDWNGFALREMTAQITDTGLTAKIFEKNSAARLSLSSQNSDVAGLLDLGKAGNVTVNGKAGETLDVTADIKNLQPHLLRGPLRTELGNLRPKINGSLRLSGSYSAPELATKLQASIPGQLPARFDVDGSVAQGVARLNITGSGKGIKTAKANVQCPTTFSLEPFVFDISQTAPLSGAAIFDGNVFGGSAKLDAALAGPLARPAANAKFSLMGIDLSQALAATSDAATAQAVKGKISGDLTLASTADRHKITGTITSPQIDIAIPERFGDSVPQLNIVERKSQKNSLPVTSAITLDVILALPERIFVRGWGLDAEFGGKLAVTGTAQTPLVEGSLELLRGRYEEFGRRLTLSKATLDFRGAVPPSPYLDVLAETRVDDTTVQVRLSGNIDTPKINFTAIPPMPEDEALSRLLFGRNLAAISPAQGLQLAQTLRRFSGQGGGIDPLGMLRAGIGLDDLDIESDDEGGASVGAGKYLAKDVYLEVQSGTARKSGGAKLRIDLAPNVKFESRVGQDSGSGGGIFWEREY